MDPLSLGLGLAGIGSSIAGGLFGMSAQDKATEAQKEIFKKIQAELASIPLPELQAVKLEEYKSAGLLTPEMESALTLGPSAMENISVDPRLREAQMGALNQLSEIADNGYTVEEQAAMNKMLDQVNQQEQGQRQALMQNMQARGLGGSGMELANQLSGIQGGANRASQTSLDVAANAQRRALQALEQQGSLGQSMERQQFDEASQVAQAKDAINKFNMQNQQNVMNQNTGLRNQAQQYNLEQGQKLSNANTDIRNTNAGQANVINQQNYQNKMNKANTLAGVQSNYGNLVGQQGQQQAAAYAGMGNAVGQGLIGMGNAYNQQGLNDAMTEYYKKKAGVK